MQFLKSNSHTDSQSMRIDWLTSPTCLSCSFDVCNVWDSSFDVPSVLKADLPFLFPQTPCDLPLFVESFLFADFRLFGGLLLSGSDILQQRGLVPAPQSQKNLRKNVKKSIPRYRNQEHLWLPGLSGATCFQQLRSGYSGQRRIQNSVKHLRWSIYENI